jgi:hypothetical protein
VLALAEIQLLWTSERLAVIYLLDQSLSIPEEQRRAMRDYVTREVREHRKQEHDDLAGVIVFGRDASIEVAPFDDDIQPAGQFESLFQVPRDATNLAAALKLANAAFPENVARRIVIVTDGNENLGRRAHGSERTRRTAGDRHRRRPRTFARASGSGGGESVVCRPTSAKASPSRRGSSSTTSLNRASPSRER